MTNQSFISHYKPEDLVGKHIVTILNLKPRTLKGETSNGMLLAASDKDKKIVRVLEPPQNSAAGDRVYLEGEKPSTPAERVSAKAWEKIVALLSVQNGKATFDKIPLVTEKGYVTASGLPDGSEIH